MSRPFLPEITYMRGLCMLGVVAIHVGSYALGNPHANPVLIGVLEILSRFAVPAFFFLSAFGLFYHTSVEDPFSYKDFMKRRIQVVLWPYITWSLFYLFYNAMTVGGTLTIGAIVVNLLFGTAMYQLYFLVLLLWFYVCMPLWRWMVRKILVKPVLWMTILFIVQVAIDYWSSYVAYSQVTPMLVNHPWLAYMFSMRLNYWIVLYIWIFLLGAVVAERYEVVMNWLWEQRLWLTTLFGATMVLMLSSYYYVMQVWHYTMLEAVYTVHQLSPMGVIYTGVAVMFFFFAFRVTPMSFVVRNLWQGLGDTSYGIYLIHPLWLLWITNVGTGIGWTYTAWQVCVLYALAMMGSYVSTCLLQRLPKSIRAYLLGH